MGVDIYDKDGNRVGSGFWPGGAGADKEGAKSGQEYPPAYQDDTDLEKEFDGGFVIEVSPEEADAAREKLEEREDSDDAWSLNNNCTDHACDVGRAGGVEIPEDEVTTRGWHDPSKLYDYLNKTTGRGPYPPGRAEDST